MRDDVIALAVVEPTDWWALLGLAFGTATMWVGWRAWHGQLAGFDADRQPRYQTSSGKYHVCLPIGGGFAVISLGELVRGVAGLDSHGVFFWTTSLIGCALLVVGLVYLLAYQWTDIPPRLRPPHQRGQPPLYGRSVRRDRRRTRRGGHE